ncbi:MAG: DUF1638 domain-containing protein [Thermoleophilia bacterium]|nr:DUF1638 domain-containing protein [Thermoleophilia bacterium]
MDDELAWRAAAAPRLLVLACGAIARETLAVVRANRLDHVEVRCLPAKLHSTPALIPAAVDAKLAEIASGYDAVFVGYADCGTAGALDPVLAKYGAERLPGAHCYGFFAGNAEWEALHDAQPATFYLTDFLARHFESLVWRALKLDRYPQLLPQIFGNYERVLYLAQTDDDDLTTRAQAAAEKLGLAFERRRTGYGELEPALTRFTERRLALA